METEWLEETLTKVKSAQGELDLSGTLDWFMPEEKQENKTLQQIDLSNSDLDQTDAEALAALINENKSLQHINLASNRFGDAGAQALAAALKENKSLQHINLGENELGDAAVQALAAALSENETLQEINLSYNTCGDIGVQAFAAALKGNKSLRTIGLDYFQIGIAGVRALAEALKENKSLREIILEGSGLDDAGAQAIAAALKENHSLRQINLSKNYIDDAGAQALAVVMHQNKSLEGINLGYNKYGDAGARALVEALKSNKSLREIHLGSRKLGDAGVQAIALALKFYAGYRCAAVLRAIACVGKQVLRRVSLEASDAGEAGAKAFATVLKENKSLLQLSLAYNKLGESGALAIAAALKENKSLQHIDLEWNRVREAGTQALAAALKDNFTLLELRCDFTHLGITAALERNRRLANASKALQAVFAELGLEGYASAFIEQKIWLEDIKAAESPDEWKDEIPEKGPRLRLWRWRQKQHGGSSGNDNTSVRSASLSPSSARDELLREISLESLSLGKPLRSGGFGLIYRTTWRNTDVAVKVMNAGTDASAVAEFQREAKLTMSLAHECLVPTLAACLEPPQLAIVMPWFDRSLKDVLFPAGDSKAVGSHQHPLAESQRFEIACDIVAGLAFLHGGDVKVVHGDLKPDNIMLNQYRRARLADFGQSRIQYTERSAAVGMRGTIAYMAPELLADGKATPAVDVYSLGVLLAELFSGRRLWGSLKPQQIEIKLRSKEQPTVPVELAPGIAQLCRHCMSPSPSARPTASAVLRRLQELKSAAASAEPAAAWRLPSSVTEDGLVAWQQIDADTRIAELDSKQPEFQRIKAMCEGVKVSRVVAVQNDRLEAAFDLEYRKLKQLLESTRFRPSAVSFVQASKKRLLGRLDRHIRDVPGVRGLVWGFNGTDEKMAMKMARNGIINYKTKDADAALYPIDLYPATKTAKGEYALVLCHALVGNVYPITRDTDYKDGAEDSDFLGKPMTQQFDTHFVAVDPDEGWQAEDDERPPKRDFCFEEIVLARENQALPRYIIYFTDIEQKYRI